METLAIIALVVGLSLWGRFVSQSYRLWYPIGMVPPDVCNRERLVEIRRMAWRVREAIFRSLEAGLLLDNVEADLRKLRKLEPQIKQAHTVRNALATFSSAVEFAISVVGQAAKEDEIGECRSVLTWDHEHLQDAIDKALD